MNAETLKPTTDIEQQIEKLLLAANLGTQYWWLNADPELWDMLNKNVECYDAKSTKKEAFRKAKKGDLVVGYKMYAKNPSSVIGQKGFTCVVALFVVSRENNGTDVEYTKITNIQDPFLTRDELLAVPTTNNIVGNGKNRGSFKDITKGQFTTIISMMIQKGVLTLANFQTAINSIPSLIGVSSSQSTTASTSVQSSTTYDETDFCKEVYGFDSTRYQELKVLLETKKNIILQGAPGVGKTYAAKRLAYAIMGEKDDSRIEFVQFHQNYAYENFVMGYKPNGNGGFDLTKGIFYKFCKDAEKSEKPYFFIIDEINRGNLSKIFGELLMLIEKGYRGNINKVKLAYKDELFSVPKNLYIIGMMNTADRSLAMIDYALRRRFSFYDMKPEFASLKDQFTRPNDDKVLNVIEAIESLNKSISDSLGEGFCIGHSYFCELNSPVDSTKLNNIINFDIIPMLKEYWFDDTKTFEQESNKLRDALK